MPQAIKRRPFAPRVSAGELLAGRLRTWRERREVPIKRAAAELGVAAATWDHWEKGRRFPNLDDLDLLARYLDLPPCLLLCPLLRDRCGCWEAQSGERVRLKTRLQCRHEECRV